MTVTTNFNWHLYFITTLTSGIIGYGIAIYVRKYVKTNIETVFDERRIETIDSLMSRVNLFDSHFQTIYIKFEEKYADISVDKILNYTAVMHNQLKIGSNIFPNIPSKKSSTSFKEEYEIFKKIADESKNNFDKLEKIQKQLQLDDVYYSTYISGQVLSLIHNYMFSAIKYSLLLLHGESRSLPGENRLVESKEIRNFLEKKSDFDFKKYDAQMKEIGGDFFWDHASVITYPVGKNIVTFVDKWKKYECNNNI